MHFYSDYKMLVVYLFDNNDTLNNKFFIKFVTYPQQIRTAKLEKVFLYFVMRARYCFFAFCTWRHFVGSLAKSCGSDKKGIFFFSIPETFFLSCLGSIGFQSQGWCTGARVVAVRDGGHRPERREQLGNGTVRRDP